MPAAATDPLAPLFISPAGWQVFASGRASGRLSPLPDGPGLRLDYDFHGGSGFVVIRRSVHTALPDTFDLTLNHRGSGPPNHLEFKVASPGGTNVWRHLRENHPLPPSWQTLTIRERDLPFAWGPAGGGPPSDIEAIEIAITAGPGGKGTLDLTTAALTDRTASHPATVSASSSHPHHPPEAPLTHPDGPGWRPLANDPAPWWAIDFGQPQRFGGLVIRWRDPLPPRAFRIETATDPDSWSLLHTATRASGPLTHVPAPDGEARFLRIQFSSPTQTAIQSFALKPDAFASSPNEFIHSVARDYPYGWFPRCWYREQSYWTPVGSPDGTRRALINEEGLVEIDEAAFSLEPYILTDQTCIDWSQAATSAHLPQGGAPVPNVRWQTSHASLTILPWIDGRGNHLTLHVTYRLLLAHPARQASLAIAARPFQVNPPWQAFRNLGGRATIHTAAASPRGAIIGDRPLYATPPPTTTRASRFEEGPPAAFLTKKILPETPSVNDETGLASALMLWNLPDGIRSFTVTLSIPFFNHLSPPSPSARHNAIRRWRRHLGKVQWITPDCATPAFDCLRTAAGHILIHRDGPAIQPGPRRYTRSWIRDCVIMGAALARCGLPTPLIAFLDWYKQFQRNDGFVPCVVDRDGVDWLVEHDSHGQFLWGIREAARHGANPRFLHHILPHALLAAKFLITLRNQPTTHPTPHTRGLLPESASHEGYLAHPVHSYWDDFWGIRGLEAAADIASRCHHPDDAKKFLAESGRFLAAVQSSLIALIREKKLAYIPGSVEWADFDPTATSNAVALLDFAADLPAGPLDSMFATYLDGFRAKHRGSMPWNNYTAYEIRIIAALVRLGKRTEANELLQFFLTDRRPTSWNQWPEITWRNPRAPGHLGDVPHTWIAAEYILALTSMVADDREASRSLVLAPGMPWDWIASNPGFEVRHLPTPYGPLHFFIHAPSHSTIHIRITIPHLPPGGLFLHPPLPPNKHITLTHSPHATIDPSGKKLKIKKSTLTTTLDLETTPP